jgi:hypothetical protein
MVLINDISVVVQGPIHTQDNLTKRVLESVRTHLPDAELILSTWKGSQIDGLDCDVLLLNDDPGAINGHNVNRQIVSTRNGLQKATRTYAVKLRTDTQLTGTGFIDAFDKYPERREDFKVFEHKIVIPTLYTRNPRRSYLFHPSDVFQFGLRSDMIELWSIPLYSKTVIFNSEFGSPPEQFLWLSVLKEKGFNITCSLNTLSPLLAFVSEASLFNNFIIQSFEDLTLKPPERFIGFSGPHLCYTKREIESAYNDFCVQKKKNYSFQDYFYFLIKFSVTKFSLSYPTIRKIATQFGVREIYLRILGISR